MKIKISKTYLNEALRIREQYHKLVHDLDVKIPILTKHRNELEEIKKRVVSVDLDENVTLEESIFNELKIVDERLIAVKMELEPIYNGIESLQSESNKLYDAVTQKYPKLNKKEIESQIWEKVKHIIV